MTHGVWELKVQHACTHKSKCLSSIKKKVTGNYQWLYMCTCVCMKVRKQYNYNEYKFFAVFLILFLKP